MIINVWSNFSKRKNSTKIPSDNGTQINCTLKEETSIEKPHFILAVGLANYTYVKAFGKYYFVTDIVSLNANQSEVACELDVLATFRNEIFAYNAFVERSASSYDVFINDPLLSGQQKIVSISSASTPMDFLGGSSYVAQVMTKTDGVVLYATQDLTPYKQILTPSCYDSQDVLDWIDSKIAQAFDLDVYVGSIKWLPINPNHIGSLSNDFYIGPVDVGVPATYNIYKATNITDRRHVLNTLSLPSENIYGDFRDCSPAYTKYLLRLPGVGLVQLDSAILGSCINDGIGLSLQMDIDYVTGDISYYLMRNTGQGGSVQTPFARYNGNISVNVPIAKSSADLESSARSVAGGVVGGAVSGGVPGAIIGGVVGLVGAIHNELTPDTSILGGSGNKSEIRLLSQAIRIYKINYGSKQYPTQVAGRPLMQNTVIGNLSGFCKCGNASVPINGNSNERDQINSYLNNGFYVE